MVRSTESQIQAAICDYLSLKGYLFSRTNNAPIYDRIHGAFRALPKYTRRGWPDICLIKQGQFIGIEVKAEKGRMSDDQKLLGEEIERNGGRYIVARAIDDLQKAGL
jgi:hypothetical protein